MKMICINCPKGCELDVVVNGDDVTVTGHTCPRGEAYEDRRLPHRQEVAGVPLPQGPPMISACLCWMRLVTPT